MPLARCLLLSLALAVRALATPAEDLAQAELFAFGGIGYAGVTSNGERDFGRVIAGPKVAEQLAWVATHGRPAARVYAMVGLHHVDRAAYERLKGDIAALHCATMTGCIGGTVDGSDVLRDIENGRFLWPAAASNASKPTPATPTPVWLHGMPPASPPK